MRTGTQASSMHTWGVIEPGSDTPFRVGARRELVNALTLVAAALRAAPAESSGFVFATPLGVALDPRDDEHAHLVAYGYINTETDTVTWHRMDT